MIDSLKKLRQNLHDLIQSAHQDGVDGPELPPSDTTGLLRDRVVAQFIDVILNSVEAGRELVERERKIKEVRVSRTPPPPPPTQTVTGP